MQRRKKGAPLSFSKFGKRGHRSRVSGLQRFLAGRKKHWIGDLLHEDAKAIMRRVRTSGTVQS